MNDKFQNDVSMGRVRRKIVQLAACGGVAHEPGAGNVYQSELYALCNDGTVWCLDGRWTELKEIPQPKIETEIPPDTEPPYQCAMTKDGTVLHASGCVNELDSDIDAFDGPGW
jgi:hypothetical protein